MQTRTPSQLPNSFSTTQGVESPSSTDLSVHAQAPASEMHCISVAPETVSTSAQAYPSGQPASSPQVPPQKLPSPS